MHCVIGEHPPTHTAPHGTLWRDRDGLHWEQKSRARLIGLVGSYRMMGGSDWQVFTPHGSMTGILWSSDGFGGRLTAVAGTVNSTFAGTSSATDRYFTLFPVRRTFRVRGMVLPIRAYTNGTVSVKIGIYQKSTTNAYMAYKLADSRLLFAASALTPVGAPFLIPFNSSTQDGLILRKGADVYVCHVWGAAIDGGTPATIATRTPFDFGGTNTDNYFRTDRYELAGTTPADYTSAIATLMSTTYSGSIGSAGTGVGLTDWGMYGDFLD